MNRTSLAIQRLTSREKTLESAAHKVETHTKTQRGGRVIKSGFADVLGIQAGDDLQLYDEHFDKAATLASSQDFRYAGKNLILIMVV